MGIPVFERNNMHGKLIHAKQHFNKKQIT